MATQSLDKQKHFYVAGHTYYRATRLLSLCDDRPGQDRCLLSPQAQSLGQNAKWQISTASSCCSCMFLDKKVSSPSWLIREGAWGCRVIPVPTLSGHQGPWGYTLSLGRYEALHLHFNGQDNEKKERSIIDRPASGPSKIRFGRPRLEAHRVLAAQMGQTPESELYVQYIRKVSPRKNLTCQVVQ